MKRPAPTHATMAGRTYLQLRTKAREQGRGTEELLQLHALESLVDRLSTTAHRQELVLKGGVLLGVRRASSDA